MADKINQEVLDQLLVEVTSEIAEYLRKDEAALRKAQPFGEDDESVPSEESEGDSGPAAPEASASEEGSPDMDAPPPGAAEGSPQMDQASAAPEGSAPHEGGEIEPAPTVEGLQQEYMKLDPEALKMHYMACKSALMSQMGAGPEASPPMAPEASAPAMSAPAAPPAAPEASAPMAMGELKAAKDLGSTVDGANGGEISAGSKLGKSEAQVEIESLKQRLAKSENDKAEQEKQLLDLAMKLTAPLRKSIKGISELAFVPKEGASEKTPAANLSKNEITAKLREKARGDLKKSDRDLINQYTCNLIDVSKIEHLLVE